jgi:hypothetical protein
MLPQNWEQVRNPQILSADLNVNVKFRRCGQVLQLKPLGYQKWLALQKGLFDINDTGINDGYIYCMYKRIEYTATLVFISFTRYSSQYDFKT